ncbi:tRNA (5-methylaminomethyl-2-thiouridylate)-methyltransferase [Trichosporon asahii var. asahii CBS 2479]|uniref:tRNA-5-taurinomethyluridine 2-sulfurtransferase n=1 Tax=Trichosporon asahii var. asahii (strain ATCC 90039 / CBS 2479 / JCM 2466 / KCTC 7840 / NBRC 103889/ NCYC 2677 / UAMH 7654) TaxID=1186058 RepID=J5THJ0_TRIAS|nr:tRNA (5-methylaminomethyl-2-thiouridylate)-methyltransferase [Trichosporon asahii var. asahii CBS 2479]EJT50951.1 tRNA (5-methylaminomethyl-2-thiouridylate)-methyltransferase [Trichosporon asahii var. asahii CBS 2479]
MRVRPALSWLPRSYSTAAVRLPTLEDLYLKKGDNGDVLRELPLNLSVLFMRNWDPLLSENADELPLSLSYGTPATHSPCSWERDWEDVKRVCKHVGIPQSDIRLVDLSKEYWTRVFEPAIAVWEAGQTPNPDLTLGHYARVKRSPDGATLHRALDANKDQTYYLSQVREEQLAKAVFPLAGIPKPSVRDLARHFNLPTAEREESMGVCFIGERGKFGDFVSQYTSLAEPGYFVNLEGERMAPHRGNCYYTIGQRPRLGGLPGGRWYIARKHVNGNDILLVQGADHPALYCEQLWSSDFNWIAGHPPEHIDNALIQIRHRMEPVPGRVSVEGRVRVDFDKPVGAVAEGQIVGVWDGDRCLGSGVIEETKTSA